MKKLFITLIILGIAGSAFAFETRTFVPDLTDPIKISGNSIPASGDWAGTFDNQEGSYYLDFRNLTDTATTSMASITTLSSLSLPVSQLTGDLPFSNLVQVSAASVLGNVTGSTADAASISTSTFFGAGVQGQVLGWDGTKTIYMATATCLAITGSADLCDGGDATGVGGGVYPFTPAVWGLLDVSATTTALQTPGGIISSSSIGNLIAGVLTGTSTATFIQATTTSFAITSITSALSLAGADGSLSEYTGINCTSQFVRDVSAAGAGTCESVANTDLTNSTISGVALGGTLNALTATNGTLTFSASYTGAAAATVGLNLSSVNSWTGGQSFLSATTTGTLAIPQGAAPVIAGIGALGYDTTDKQFLIGTSSLASSFADSPIVIPAMQKLWGATVASTSADWVSGGRIPMPPQRDGFYVREIHCFVDGGTSVVINISNSGGTTDSETVTCDADGAVDTSIDTNLVYAAGSLNSLEIGTITGAVDYVTFSVWGFITRE